ncbi:hypothetical protein MKW92_018950 [Papaver armeniacum]|nr:hypothetical protein MKW92_018950 [Papaver armeniacum]
MVREQRVESFYNRLPLSPLLTFPSTSDILSLRPKAKDLVFDSYRPIHLRNLTMMRLITRCRSRKRRRVSDDTDSDPVKLSMESLQERRNTNELLWLACVSLTDQFFHGRLTNEIPSWSDGSNISTTRIRAPDSARIGYEYGPRLMLLREWNLFDSMLDNGLRKLQLLLSPMGFALVDCQQKFQYMNLEVKKKMKDEFERFLPEYGLNEIYYRSFLWLHGYRMDLVLLISLVLHNLTTLRKGMQGAIRVQRAILRQGRAAITKSGSIRSGRKFRWVKLEDAADTKLMGYPQALTEFCYFLADALREKGAKMKPLNKVLIVGVCGKPRLGAVQENALGVEFRAASSWIVLDTKFVNSFMIRLTEKL